MNRKTSTFTLILLAITIALIPSVYAEYPIENLEVVQGLPGTLVAGNTYCMNITFDNVAHETVALTIHITVTGEDLGSDEILINEVELNGVVLDCNEDEPGFFTAEGVLTATFHNRLDITVSTKINLMPGNYTFEVDLLGEEMTEPRPPRPIINKLPIADTGPNQTVDIGQLVELSGANSTDPDGYLTSWTWDFGDGAEASGVNASHRYLMAGNYTVTLTVVDVRYGEDTDTCTITVMEHVITPPLPPFLDNLTITPSDLELGDSVTVSLDIMNPNDGAIGYGFTMEIGDLTLLVDVELEPYESKTMSRTVTPTAIGTHNVTVIGMTGNFTVKPALIPLKPAEFVLSELEASPVELEEGEDVSFDVDVLNIGEMAGTYTIEFKVDGETIEMETVTLAPSSGYHAQVSFETLIAGTYQVSVGDLTETFTVLAPEPESEPAEFEFSNLVIVPKEDLSVTISVDMVNIGEETGTYTVELELDGEALDTEEVTLEGDASAMISFELTRGEGTYEVEVEGLTGSFTIVLPEPDPPFWTGPKIAVIVIVVIGGIMVTYVWRKRR